MTDQFDARDHWETLFDHTYLRWFDLHGQPALVEIVSVDKNVELTLRGGAKKKAPVLQYKQLSGKIEHTKPLVLNRTNSNLIAGIHGTKPSGWIGKQVVLFQDTDKLKGETVPCIRIRAKKE